MRISPEVEVALSLAADEAARRRHEYVTVEHLLFALLFDDATAKVVTSAGGKVDAIKKQLSAYLDSELEALPEDSDQAPIASLGVQRALRRAMAHVQSSGKEVVSGANVLVAIYAERDSYAVSLLEKSGVTRLDVVAFISHGIAKGGDGADEGRAPAESGEQDEGGPVRGDPLKQFTTNLNEEAKEGRIDPLVGRSTEVDRMVQILARRKKNNPILVGDPGVGKTAIVEGLARKIVEGDVPPSLLTSTVYSLDMGAVIAGTQFRGQFEERVKAVVKALQKIEGAILFIDEIHTIVGAGSTRGSVMDASNLLKPALASGRLRCVGSTTFDEYRQNFEKDRALARRFQKIDVNEPSVEDTIKVLKGIQKQYEEFHGVTYTVAAIEAAATLSARYLHDRKLPDKAIDLVDEAGAAIKLSKGKGGVVDVGDVETVLSKMAHIPPREVVGDDRKKLLDLEGDLRKAVFGQDAALTELVSAIKLSRAGLRSPEKPIGSFLLTGPTGVGKTEAAKQLAKTMGIQFVRFDMSEYMERHSVSRLIGAPPGYVGFDQGGLLTEAIAKTPHAVLLLDEIEKAHPDVFNILLQVMDHGRLTDNNGKTTDFRHVILIMTSNVGVRDLQRRAVGFAGGQALGDAEKEYKRLFSPEFRNRLDARVDFAALSPDTMDSIVLKFVRELEVQLLEKDVTITLTDGARKLLAEKGYDPEMGARPLARVIQEELKRPLGEELLFGKLEHGGAVRVDVADGKLTFSYDSHGPDSGRAKPAPTLH